MFLEIVTSYWKELICKFLCLFEISQLMLWTHFMYTHINGCFKFFESASLLISLQPMAWFGTVTMSKISDMEESTPIKLGVHAFHVNLYLHQFFGRNFMVFGLFPFMKYCNCFNGLLPFY